MFGSGILEVIIGLVFVYLITSLLCSAFREGIAKIFSTKAKILENELVDLVKSEKLVEKIKKHYLVKAPKNKLKLETKAKPIDHISTKNFATALIDILVDGDKEKGEKDDITIFRDIDENFQKIENIKIRKILRNALRSTRTKMGDWEKSLQDARKSIEDWFDNSMDKLSVWYKKRTRHVIFWIGVIICITLNLDSIQIAKKLYRNESLRESIVAAAVNVTEKSSLEEFIEKKSKQKEKTNTEENVPKKEEKKITVTLEDLYKEYKNLNMELKELGFPIGWKKSDFSYLIGNNDKTKEDDKKKKGQEGNKTTKCGVIIYRWFLKILGLILTAIAISLGAPFWFDMIRKLVSLRKAATSSENNRTMGATA
jgi:hypothetical protein